MVYGLNVAQRHVASRPIALFRCIAEFGRYRGLAGFGKPSPGRFMGSRPSIPA
jgi:hypothetical protein